MKRKLELHLLPHSGEMPADLAPIDLDRWMTVWRRRLEQERDGDGAMFATAPSHSTTTASICSPTSRPMSDAPRWPASSRLLGLWTGGARGSSDGSSGERVCPVSTTWPTSHPVSTPSA
jgi:hypothetical protein